MSDEIVYEGMLSRIIDKVNSAAWAIYPPKLDAIHELLRARLSGENNVAFQAADQQKAGEKKETSYLRVDENGIGILSIMGTIGRRLNVLEQMSGGVSTEILMRDFAKARDSSLVKAILLHIDSPGGVVDGTKELAEMIFESRGVKPVVAYTDGLMASAAYWIGSAADEVIAYPTAQVGSIGVAAMHVDYSKMDERRGVKRTYIYQGKYKRIANDAEPLNDEGKAYLQGMIDDFYGIFVDDVARNRGVKPKEILATESKLFIAASAEKEGLVDTVGSFELAYANCQRRYKDMEYSAWKGDFPKHVEAITKEIVAGLNVLVIGSDRPDLAVQLKVEGAKEERERVTQIREAAFEGQEALVSKLISDGTPVTEAIKTLNQDEKKKRVETLGRIEKDAPGDLGANPSGDSVAEGKALTAKTKKEAGDKLDALAKTRATERNIPYAEAFRQVCSENEELNAMYLGRKTK